MFSLWKKLRKTKGNEYVTSFTKLAFLKYLLCGKLAKNRTLKSCFRFPFERDKRKRRRRRYMNKGEEMKRRRGTEQGQEEQEEEIEKAMNGTDDKKSGEKNYQAKVWT